MNTPESTACPNSATSGRSIGQAAAGLPRLFSTACRLMSGHDQLGAGRRHVLWPDDDPAAVLHLLHAHQVVAAVVGSVEAQHAVDRPDLIFLQPAGENLVVETPVCRHG